MVIRKLLFACLFTALFACSTSQQTTNAGKELKPYVASVKSVEPAEQQEIAEKPSDAAEEINRLKARIEDLNNRVYVLTEQMDSIRARFKTETPAAFTELEKQEKQEHEIESFNAVSSGMKKQYLQAYSFLKAGKYAKGLIAFSSFIEKYPDSVLTDNAYYWLGECYFEQREYALAIDEYLKVIKKFPDGSKTPDAMLKVAISYNRLGEKADSESYYKELMMRFPKSRASMLAKNKLKEFAE
ncbi:MAG: tol-pal system protein YbgF [Oligoflexia bacterium]|nr:tol-pal system protein YbgF [Oligoflexia bacterium]